MLERRAITGKGIRERERKEFGVFLVLRFMNIITPVDTKKSFWGSVILWTARRETFSRKKNRNG